MTDDLYQDNDRGKYVALVIAGFFVVCIAVLAVSLFLGSPDSSTAASAIGGLDSAVTATIDDVGPTFDVQQKDLPPKEPPSGAVGWYFRASSNNRGSIILVSRNASAGAACMVTARSPCPSSPILGYDDESFEYETKDSDPFGQDTLKSWQDKAPFLTQSSTRIRIINIAQEGCVPCAREMPILIDTFRTILRDTAPKPKGIEFVLIGLDSPHPSSLWFGLRGKIMPVSDPKLATLPASMRIRTDSNQLWSKLIKAMNDDAPVTLPTTLLVDACGKVILHYSGALSPTAFAKIRSEVDRLDDICAVQPGMVEIPTPAQPATPPVIRPVPQQGPPARAKPGTAYKPVNIN